MDRIDTLIREVEGASVSAERGVILDALTYAHASKWIDAATFHRAQKMLRVGAFLSAVLPLMPEGYAIEKLMIWPGQPSDVMLLGTHFQNGEYWHTGKDGRWKAEAATPALALCIAALKARSAS